MERKNPKVKKTVIVGDTATGKSSLMQRLSKESFDEEYQTTMGAEYQHIITDDDKYKFVQWATCGNERFKSTLSNFRGDLHIVVLVFDVANIESFNHLDQWVEEIKEHKPENIEYLLVGNKRDVSRRQVSETEAEIWALRNNMFYLDYSAKDDSSEVFMSKLCEVADKQES